MRKEIAVKARLRRSDAGLFFSCQDEKLNAAEARVAAAEARVLALDREKARPFFFRGWAGPANPFCRWT